MTLPTPSELATARSIACEMGVDMSNLEALDPRIEMTLLQFRVRRHVVRLRAELAEHESKLPVALIAA